MKKTLLKVLLTISFLPSISFAQSSSYLNFGMKELSLSAGIDYQSYYNSGVSTSSFSLGLNANERAFKLSSFAVLQNREGLKENLNFTWSIQEAYYQLGLKNGDQIKLGRAFFNESEHGELELSGFWNNSWDFRKDDPLQEGLIGAFFEKEINKNFSFKAFASVIAVPKITEHYGFDDEGGLVATTPWFAPPPDRINYSGENYSVNYFLDDIDYIDLAVQPQFGLTTKIVDESMTYNFLYLYAPSKELDLGLSFLVNAATPEVPIDLTISPERAYMHKLGFEGVKKWSESSRTTLSVSAQIRQNELPLEENLSWIGVDDGVYSFLAHQFKVLNAKAKIFATLSTLSMDSNGELDSILRDSLSINYRFSNGVGGQLSRSFGSKFNLNLLSYYDAKNEGALFRLSMQTRRRRLNAEVGVSFIEALNASTTGFYKDYRENDQIYTRFSYVF